MTTAETVWLEAGRKNKQILYFQKPTKIMLAMCHNQAFIHEYDGSFAEDMGSLGQHRDADVFISILLCQLHALVLQGIAYAITEHIQKKMLLESGYTRDA